LHGQPKAEGGAGTALRSQGPTPSQSSQCWLRGEVVVQLVASPDKTLLLENGHPASRSLGRGVSVSSIKIEGSAEVGGEKLTDAGSLCKIGGVDNHLEWRVCILDGYLVAAMMPDERS